MSVADLISGNWHWKQLIYELLVALIPILISYFAGYWRGRVAEYKSTRSLEGKG